MNLLNQFEIFCAVAEDKSLTRAAKRLHLSQPAVSSQIKAMENTYQLCLFERTNLGVELTKAGRIAYQYAKQLIHIHEDMKEALISYSKSQPCRLVVGASTVIGGFPLPCSIWVFKEHHPQADVKLEVANSKDILEKVRTASLDLAIIEGPVNDASIKVIPCADDEMVLITPYDEPWIDKEEITLEELKKAPLIIREKGSGMRVAFEEALKSEGVTLSDLKVVTEMGNLDAIKSTVESGHGVSIMPRSVVRKEIYTKMLKAFQVKELDLKLKYKIIYHEKQILSDIAKAFIKLITNPKERSFC